MILFLDFLFLLLDVDVLDDNVDEVVGATGGQGRGRPKADGLFFVERVAFCEEE